MEQGCLLAFGHKLCGLPAQQSAVKLSIHSGRRGVLSSGQASLLPQSAGHNREVMGPPAPLLLLAQPLHSLDKPHDISLDPCYDFSVTSPAFSAEATPKGPSLQLELSRVSALVGRPGAPLSLPRDDRHTHKPFHLWGETDENKSALKFHENKITCLFI